jgi:hypothetical protein
MQMLNITGAIAKNSSTISKVAFFGFACDSMTWLGFYAPELRMGGERHFNNLRNFSVQEKSKLYLSGGSTD